MKTKEYLEVVEKVSQSIKKILLKVSEETLLSCEEIRLRVNLPLALTVFGKTFFVKEDGNTTEFISSDLVYVTKEDVNETYLNLCENSVYAHENEIKQGYISLKNGSRAGICARFSSESFPESVLSINIRIAHGIKGVGSLLFKEYQGGGVLIAGPPCSGKTTLLRDFIRLLSNSQKRVSVIDTREEISGFGKFCLGNNTDILIIDDKAKGVEMAIRTMFPQIIAFDEIGNLRELERVKESFFSGVEIITTAHIGNKNELLQRTVTAELIKENIVSQIVLLQSNKEYKIFSAKELLNGID